MKMSIEEKRKVIREAQIIARNLASVNVWAREYGQKNSHFLITPLLEIVDDLTEDKNVYRAAVKTVIAEVMERTSRPFRVGGGDEREVHELARDVCYLLRDIPIRVADHYEDSVLLNEFETDKLLKEVRDRLPAAPTPVPQYVWILASDDAGEIGQPHMAFKTRRAALERIKRDSWCFAESRVRIVKSTRWQMSWRMSWAATNLAGNFVERAAWLLKMEVSDE